jgi:hypothetical protein
MKKVEKYLKLTAGLLWLKVDFVLDNAPFFDSLAVQYSSVRYANQVLSSSCHIQ